MQAQRRLAIIGGGSVATSFFCQLVHALTAFAADANGAADAIDSIGSVDFTDASGVHRMHIRIFEPQALIGPGGAYAADLDSNLLNVVASGMSAYGDDKLHFMRWLSAQGITSFNGRPIRKDSFLSRPLFGAYLHATYRDALARATAAGITVEHVRAVADDIVAGGPRVAGAASSAALTVCAGGVDYAADHVVLALGNLPPTAYAQWRGQADYFHSPYPVSGLQQSIATDANVAIAGTSLSAIDTIVALASHGHRGKIYCVSRSGRLPTVRGVHNAPITLPASIQQLIAQKESNGEKLPLRQVMDLLSTEIKAAGSSPEDIHALLAPCADTHAYLDAEIEIASSKPRQWQALGNILNGVIDRLWHLLPDADRLHFHNVIRPLWLARRVAFPMENALILQRMIRSGQLHISGGLQNIERCSSGAGFVVQQRSDASNGAGAAGNAHTSTKVDVLINATSFSVDAAQTDIALLDNLLRRGLAQHDPFGGLKLDFSSGRLLSPTGEKRSAISVLGSMGAGTWFWTNAMDVNARLAMHQARSLAASWTEAASIPAAS